MQYKTIILVDGENLVMRYQRMLSDGKKPLEGILHERDCFVWHPQIFKNYVDIVRVGYYTTVAGDDAKLNTIEQKISEAPYDFETLATQSWEGTLVPHVFKKSMKEAKTKSVDINLTIDALRYAYGNSIDKVVLITGDGDYIPLLREVMAQGKMVQVMALSNGLNKYLKYNADDLIIIDDCFFEKDDSDA